MQLGGCGGDNSGSHATLTDDGCTYEGDEATDSGTITIDVTNETAFRGTFAIFRLAEGRTLADVKADVERAQREFDESGGTPPPPPGYFDQITYVAVKPGASGGHLEAHLEPGRYFVMCFVDDLPEWKAYVTTQLVAE